MTKGRIILDGSTLCIDSSPCDAVYYTPAVDVTASQGELLLTNATLCETPASCATLHYTGPAPPEQRQEGIAIPEATTCKERSIQRCRVLLCNPGVTANIAIADISYLYVKKEGGITVWTE